MDEKQLRKINRRLRSIKATLLFLIIINLATLAIFGFLAYMFVGLSNKVEAELKNIQGTASQTQKSTNQFCGTGNSTPIGMTPDLCR